MAETNKVYVRVTPELPKVIQHEQIYVYVPRGNALPGRITNMELTAPVAAVTYDTTDGITVYGTGKLDAVNEFTGEYVSSDFSSTFKVPIKAVKGLTMDTDSGQDFIEIGVDKDELSKDFFPIDKTTNNVVPLYYNGKTEYYKLTSKNSPDTIVYRQSDGNSTFNHARVAGITDESGSYLTTPEQLSYAVDNDRSELFLADSIFDTGTLNAYDLVTLTIYPQRHIQYRQDTYYRMTSVRTTLDEMVYAHTSQSEVDGKYITNVSCIYVNKTTGAWRKVTSTTSGGGGSGNYIPIDPNIDGIPNVVMGEVNWVPLDSDVSPASIVLRDASSGGASFGEVRTQRVMDQSGGFVSTPYKIYRTCMNAIVSIASNSTATSGSLSTSTFQLVKDIDNILLSIGGHIYRRELNSTVDLNYPYIFSGIDTDDITSTVAKHILISNSGEWTLYTSTSPTGFNDISGLDFTIAGYGVSGNDSEGYTISGYGGATAGSKDGGNFATSYAIPIVGDGKYITTKADSGEDRANAAIIVGIDTDKLSGDFYKIDKTNSNPHVPSWNGSTAGIIGVSPSAGEWTLCQRDADGSSSFNNLNLTNDLKDPNNSVYHANVAQLYFSAVNDEMTVDKTATDTGTLGTDYYNRLIAYPATKIVYDNQLYFRMDPTDAPDGTLNLIHIDAIQDGNGGYKATGKCFSITSSTKAWQVVDVNFADDKMYKHNVILSSSDNAQVVLIIQNASNTQFTIQTLKQYIDDTFAQFPCYLSDNGANYVIGDLTADDSYFEFSYPSGIKQLSYDTTTIVDTIS